MEKKKELTLTASDILRSNDPELYQKVLEYKDENKEEYINFFPSNPPLRELSKMDLILYSNYVQNKDKPKFPKEVFKQSPQWP